MERENRRHGRGIWGLLTTCVLLALLVVGTQIVRRDSGSEDTPSQTLQRSNFSEEDFSFIQGRMHYRGGAYRQGIDVSVHQENVDWQAVAEDGVDFAMIRAGYRGTTEGGLFRDEAFSQHLQGAQAVGLATGAYFFSQATTVDEAIQEAELMLDILDGCVMKYPVVYDWEMAAGGRTDGMDYETVTACCVAFCQRIEQAGYRAGVYFNLEMAKYLRLTELQNYVLWLADYSETPNFAYEFQMWQYTESGKVSGIAGDVDLNLYFEPEKSAG